jgi:prolipoprotein diacylglyceryltransferase
MLPVLQIGPLALQTPGLAYLLGLWLGLSLAERAAPRYKISPETLYNLALTALISGLAGARLAFIAQNFPAFAADPGSALSLNPGLLDPWGGLAGGFLGGLIYAQRKALSAWPTLDALTPLLAVMSVAGALANLASGSGFGAPTSLPWAIEIWGAARHPSQVYELIAAAAILWLAWPRSVQAAGTPAGQAFLRFLSLSAAARLFLEAFRGDSLLIFGGLRLAQVLAWGVLAAGLWGLSRLTRKPTTGPDHEYSA